MAARSVLAALTIEGFGNLERLIYARQPLKFLKIGAILNQYQVKITIVILGDAWIFLAKSGLAY